MASRIFSRASTSRRAPPPRPAALQTLRLAVAGLAAALHAPARAEWRAAWIAAPFPAIPKLIERDERTFENQTTRQVLRIAASGERLRVRLTNELGREPMPFAEVHVGKLDASGQIAPGSDRRVLFAGRRDGVIAAGAPLLSDPVRLRTNAGERLAISVYYDKRATPAAHLLEIQLSAPGNHASAPRLPGARTSRAPALAAAVEVWRPSPTPVIVAFGDSITEGDGSTPGAHRDWPAQLSDQLIARPATRHWSVVNAGINGNRLLRNGAGPNALARFDRDGLAVAGVTQIVLIEGINDIGWGSQADRPDDRVSADELIAAYVQLIDRAHARGVAICGGTLLPYRGSLYWTDEGEAKRQKVNGWIRGAFDCVIDFDMVVADAAAPSAIAPALHRGDHLHPNDAGYLAMAEAAAKALAAPDGGSVRETASAVPPLSRRPAPPGR